LRFPQEPLRHLASSAPRLLIAMAKYLWGNETMNLNYLMVIIALSGLLIGAMLGHVGPTAAVGDAFPSALALRGVGLVTCAFVFMWYVFLGHQVSLNFDATLDADVKTGAKSIADRVVGNTLEQAMPFLVLLWLHALFVNPETSKLLGWIYVATRFLYPITFGFYGQQTLGIQIATQPNYIVVYYFLTATVYKCLKGEDLHTNVNATSPWLMMVVLFVVSFFSLIVFLVVAKPSTAVIVNGVKKEKGFVDEEDDEEEAVE